MTLQQLATLKNVSNLTTTIKAFTIAIAVLALYYQDLNIVFNDALQNEATSQILVIPFLFAYLLYRKRKMLKVVIPFESSNQPKQTRHLATISGILLCATAIILYWHGSYTFTPLEYHMMTFPIFIAGLTLILFNSQTLRQLAFPIAFLILLMPPPSEILYGLGSTLSVISSEASSAIVNTLGIPSTISSEYGNPTLLITRPDNTTLGFTVDIACSGIYSLIGFLIFAAFIAYITRDKTWKKTTIFLIGLPLFYLLNIIRITIILLIGYQYGEQLALQIFHLLGGWALIFLGTFVLLTITEKLFKTKIFINTPKCQQCNPNPPNSWQDFCYNCGRLQKYPQTKLRKSDVAKMATIAIAVILLLSIQVPVFALTKGPAQIIIQTPTGEQGNTQILPQIQGYTLQFIYRDKNFEQIAKQEASLMYSYMPLDKTKEPVWVGIEIASTKSSLHRWEECLITWPQTHGYQPKVAQLDLRDVQIFQNPPIIARYSAFQYSETNQTQVVLYWYETSTFITNSTTQQEHVKISLVTYPSTPQDITEAENQILPLATAIANHWEPIKTWTQIALLISKSGDKLVLATTSFLIAVIIIKFHDERKERNGNAKVYQKLSLANKRILDAVHKTKKTGILSNIATTYQNITCETIEREELTEELFETEKTGLIRSQIANQQDEPIRIWKTNFRRPLKARVKLQKLLNVFRK